MGKISFVAGDTMRATGLEDAGMHDIVYICDEIPALVVALQRNDVKLVPLVDTSVAPGAPVRLGGKAAIQVDPSLLGRVITGPELLAQCGAPQSDRRLFSTPQPRWGKPRRRQDSFTTGLLVHDIKGELRRGEAILFTEMNRFFALRVGSQILGYQETEGAICIFVCLRSSSSSLNAREQFETLNEGTGSIFGNNAWSRTVFLEPGRHATPVMSWLLCRAATAMAQAFAERGADVVLMVDGFFNLGGMGVNQLPGFNQFAELGILTSAADCYETGSLTILLTRHGSFETKHLQFFDKQLELERTLVGNIAHRWSKFCRPPIRVNPMHVLGGIIGAAIDADSGRGSGPNDEMASPSLRRGRRIREVLRFQNACKLDVLEQLLCVLSVERLDNLGVVDVVPFVERYVQLLRDKHADYLQTLRSAKLVDADNPSEVWVMVATEVATELKPATIMLEHPIPVRPWWKFW